MAAQATDTADVRAKLVADYGYREFYRVAPGAVEVLHIRHTSRRPWRSGPTSSQT